MKWIKLFEELNFDYGLKDGVYSFTDSQNNNYSIYFNGPLEDFELRSLGLSLKISYELEFLTAEKDFYFMTGANIAFSISNLIFGTILKDFLARHPKCERIKISALDYKRKNLYLRSINRTLKDIDFEIEFVDFPDENDIIICKKTI